MVLIEADDIYGMKDNVRDVRNCQLYRASYGYLFVYLFIFGFIHLF